jgi:predicted house-cleaning noncanonical NTP pyrophosphatase (MazG superfamily)
MKTIIHNKLVRDKVLDSCRRHHQVPIARPAQDDEEYIHYLRQKMVEEAKELAQAADIMQLQAEIADVEEVLAELKKVMGIKPSEVQRWRREKILARGAFTNRTILLKTEEDD